MATLGRVEKRPRGRVEPKKPTAVRVVSASVSTTVLTMTFDQPVVLKGTPGYTTDVAGALPVPGGTTSPSPAVVEITFDADITAATEVIIPVANPAIRNKVGGFVADTTFPVS